jgi:hypothetical protein
LLIPRYPFGIFYVAESNRIVIHAILDLRQDPEKFRASERQNGQKGGRSINDRACPSFIGSDTFVTLGRVID